MRNIDFSDRHLVQGGVAMGFVPRGVVAVGAGVSNAVDTARNGGSNSQIAQAAALGFVSGLMGTFPMGMTAAMTTSVIRNFWAVKLGWQGLCLRLPSRQRSSLRHGWGLWARHRRFRRGRWRWRRRWPGHLHPLNASRPAGSGHMARGPGIYL